MHFLGQLISRPMLVASFGKRGGNSLEIKDDYFQPNTSAYLPQIHYAIANSHAYRENSWCRLGLVAAIADSDPDLWTVTPERQS